MKVVLIGETWFVHSIHQKGFDSFTSSDYEEGGIEFVDALRARGHTVSRIAAHEIDRRLPDSVDELRSMADVIVVSDVGANSFQLSPATFRRSALEPDRIALLAAFVRGGGGLLMVGGYMSFSGIDAKARWGTTELASLLPVDLLDRDDRVEIAAGASPTVEAEHLLTEGLSEPWPSLLGLNETLPAERGIVLVSCSGHPLLAVSRPQPGSSGRSAVFTSDLAPHWAPAEFLAWHGYETLFDRTIRWLGGEN